MISPRPTSCATPSRRELIAIGDDVLVSVEPSAPAAVWGAEALWTRVSVEDGRAVRLISYDTRERALAGS